MSKPRMKPRGALAVKNEIVPVGRPPLLRQTNAQILLKLLRETGPCSKADLVRASGLSAPTVTNVVAYLASAGLVEPIGEGHSTGGRPQTSSVSVQNVAALSRSKSVLPFSVFFSPICTDLNLPDPGWRSPGNRQHHARSARGSRRRCAACCVSTSCQRTNCSSSSQESPLSSMCEREWSPRSAP